MLFPGVKAAMRTFFFPPNSTVTKKSATMPAVLWDDRPCKLSNIYLLVVNSAEQWCPSLRRTLPSLIVRLSHCHFAVHALGAGSKLSEANASPRLSSVGRVAPAPAAALARTVARPMAALSAQVAPSGAATRATAAATAAARITTPRGATAAAAALRAVACPVAILAAPEKIEKKEALSDARAWRCTGIWHTRTCSTCPRGSRLHLRRTAGCRRPRPRPRWHHRRPRCHRHRPAPRRTT